MTTTSLGLDLDLSVSVGAKKIPSYNMMHLTIGMRRGKASEYDCINCREQARDWCLKHDAKDIIAGLSSNGVEMVYSTSVYDYVPMCRSCHLRYDGVGADQKRTKLGKWTK